MITLIRHSEGYCFLNLDTMKRVLMVDEDCQFMEFFAAKEEAKDVARANGYFADGDVLRSH